MVQGRLLHPPVPHLLHTLLQPLHFQLTRRKFRIFFSLLFYLGLVLLH